MLCLFIIIAYKIPRWSGLFGNSVGYSLLSLIIMLLITYLINTKSCPRSILEFPLFIYIGKISYGIYLYHILCRDFVATFVPKNIGIGYYLIIYFLITFLFSILSYHFLEQPFLKLKNKFRIINTTSK